jgi:hypothetical protein
MGLIKIKSQDSNLMHLELLERVSLHKLDLTLTYVKFELLLSVNGSRSIN